MNLENAQTPGTPQPSPSSLDFTGRVVLITGAATGIGRAGALAFARCGAQVVIGDIDDRAAGVAQEIETGGGRALFIRTDVSDAASMRALIDGAVQAFGGLDVAWNNAGLLPPTEPVHEVDEADWDRIIQVDLKGVFLGVKYQAAHMIEHGGGSIINTSSVAGIVGDPGMAAYVAAKHGVVGLTRAAACDLARYGVRVNALAPGLVETPMTQRWLDDPRMTEVLYANNQQGRAAQPEEIVGTVLYLASDLSSFTTGGVFAVDGGQTAH